MARDDHYGGACRVPQEDDARSGHQRRAAGRLLPPRDGGDRGGGRRRGAARSRGGGGAGGRGAGAGGGAAGGRSQGGRRGGGRGAGGEQRPREPGAPGGG